MLTFTAQQEPVHHIIVTHGSEQSHFWYFLSVSGAKPFDATRDGKLVEFLHAEGTNLNIGEYKVFTSKFGHTYNVGRMDATNFSVQSLSIVGT